MLLKEKQFIDRKRLSKISSERLALKEKIKNFKSLKRISKERFQVSKIQERFQKWTDLNDEFIK